MLNLFPASCNRELCEDVQPRGGIGYAHAGEEKIVRRNEFQRSLRIGDPQFDGVATRWKRRNTKLLRKSDGLPWRELTEIHAR